MTILVMLAIHPLRAFRDAKGVSAAALAKKVGVTRQSIYRIENRQQEPSIALIRKLVAATHEEVSAEAILAECLNAPVAA